MVKKAFSEIRFSWRPLWTADYFLSTVSPYITGQLVVRDSDPVMSMLRATGGMNALTMDYLILTKDPAISHYFLESKGLFDFLADSPVKELSFAHLAATEWPDHLHVGRAISHGPAKTVVIHHQYAALPSIKVIYQLLNPGTDNSVFYVYVENGDEYAGFMEPRPDGKPSLTHVPEKFYTTDLNNEDVYDKPLYRYTRLALNLLMYEMCFPGCVNVGVPEDISNPNRYRKIPSPKTVSVTKDILHDDHSTITPHFRSGYFRVLSSDYYKAKRNKVVFTRATFVRGTAKTVSESPEAIGG
jgi:hypothetical protein